MIYNCKKCGKEMSPGEWHLTKGKCNDCLSIPKKVQIASYRKEVGDYDGESLKGMTKYRKSVGDESG